MAYIYDRERPSYPKPDNENRKPETFLNHEQTGTEQVVPNELQV